jgi:lysyl-tRNA synthetase class 2
LTNEQVEQRGRNLEALKALGVDPYPYRYEVTHRARGVKETFDALAASRNEVALAGRLMAIRGHGKSTFAHLQDETDRIQVYFKLNILGETPYATVRLLDVGDLVGVRGTVFRTKTGEMTVEVHALTFLAKCLTPLPEKWHGLRDTEIRYRQRYLDLIVNREVRGIFEARAAIVRSLRRSLDARGFLEVDTPVLQPLYGGAFARPFVTHHEALDMPLYLRISNELYLKRLIVGGIERVYEIARDFRNEGIDRTHNPEFSMLEFYQAYADYTEVLELTEELVSEAVREATGGYTVVYQEHAVDFTPPWPRRPYYEVLNAAAGEDLAGAGETAVRAAARRLGVDLEGKAGIAQCVDAIFSEVVDPTLIQPTFITDYPREMSPLAKRNRADDRLVERFELFVAGMEVANAFSEQNDPEAQARAFAFQQQLREQGDLEAQVTDQDYLRALRLGMPPTGGVGIGIDRLVMIATGAASVRDVILFPQLRPETGRAGAGDGEGAAADGGAAGETGGTDATAETRA